MNSFYFFSFEDIWFTMLGFSCPAKWFSFAYTCIWAFHLAQLLKNHPAMKEIWVQSLGREDMLRGTGRASPVFLPVESHGLRSQQATVHRVTKSRAHLSQLSLHRHTYIYLFLYKFFFHLCCYRFSSRVACGFVVTPCWLSTLYIVVSIYMLIPNSEFIPPPQLAIW